MRFLFTIKKKLLKSLAKSAPGNLLRLWLLRQCNYRIGQGVYIGEDLLVEEDLSDTGIHLEIEDRVAVAPRVTFILFSAPNQSRIRPFINERRGSITVRKDAWIGTGAVILPGIEIGEGAVVGSNAVVTKSVPDYTFVAGVPAKVVKEIHVPWRSYNANKVKRSREGET